MWDFKFQAPRYHNFFRKQKQNTRIEINRQNKNDMWFLEEHSDLTPVKQLNDHLFGSLQIGNKQRLSGQFPTKQVQINLPQKLEQVPICSHNQNSKCTHLPARPDKEQFKQAQKVWPKHKIEKLKRMDIDEKLRRESQRSVITFAGLGKSIIQKEVRNKKKQVQPTKEKQRNKLDKQSKARSSPNLEKKRRLEIQEVKPLKIRIPCPYSRRIQKDWQTRSSKSWYELSQKSAKKAIESMRKSLRKSLNQSKGNGSKDRLRFKF